MKKSLLGFLFVLLCCFLSYAQNPLVKQWDARFGGTDYEWLSSFQQTTDGGYILGGHSLSGIGGDKTQSSQGDYDYWIVKIDALGNKQWDKRIGGTSGDYLSSLQQTTDGGYILGGTSQSGIGGDKTQAGWGGDDWWIVKTDSLGNKQWDKRFGGTGDDELMSLRQTTDGGYIIGGISNSGISGDKTQANWGGVDYWIVKIDSLGNKQWDKRFGGTNNDYFYSLQQTSDGGYILGGESFSDIGGDKTQASWGGFDYWIVKIDSFGNKQWDKRFGGTDADRLNSLQQTTDRGYILGGWSYSDSSGDKTQPNWGVSYSDYWIVKVDSLGNKQWDKRFGGMGLTDFLGNISQTFDGGYLFAGTSYAPISGDKTENNLGREQTWVVKTDALGNKQWDKTLFTNSNFDDEVGYAIQTKDGCYVMANYTNAGIGGYKTQANWDPKDSTYDYWIIKFCDTTQVQQCNLKAAFSSNITTPICNEGGQCADFTDLSTCNPLSWKWFFPGAAPDTSTQQNPMGICYYIPGSYSVTLIVTDSTTSDTLTISPFIIFSSGAVAPVITLDTGNTICSSTACAYQWYLNGTPIPGDTLQCCSFIGCGVYSCYITDCNGCSILSNGFDACAGVNSISGLSMHVYPNPAGSELWVEGNGLGVGITKLEIKNVLGENVLQSELTNQKSEINVDGLAKGIYIVELTNGDKVYRAKFVKE